MKRFYLLLLLACLLRYAQAQNITKLEYFIDTDPGFGNATNVPLTATPALTDFTFNVPVSSLSNGFHTLYVRAQNASNKWSVVQNRSFVKLSLPGTISRVEYFIDTDPGFGNGTPVNFTPGTALTDLTFDVSMTSLSAGYHTLYTRVKDANNKWSTVQNRPFIKIPAKPNISYIEYYFDTDPGQGNGTSVPFTPAPIITDLNFMANVSSLSEGSHKIYVRVKNSNNKWSAAYSQDIVICNLIAPVATAATEVTSTSIKINWTAVSGATAYDVDLSQNNFTTFSTGRISTGTVGYASPLTKGTTYQYRVRAVGTTCSSVNSNVISVTTLNCDKPGKPTITISNENTETPTLSSSASAGNQWYKNGTAIAGATNNSFTITEPGSYKVQVKSGDCLSDFSNEVDIVITAIESAFANKITLHPNPAENILKLTGITSLGGHKLIDLAGREHKLQFTPHEGGLNADISHLAPGAYLLRIYNGVSFSTLKFTKK